MCKKLPNNAKRSVRLLYFTDSTYCRYGYDSEAFLFSFGNQSGWAPVKLNQSGYYSRLQYAIYSCSYYGPTFGGGHDIYIVSNAAYSSSSYSSFYTYSPPSGYGYGSSSFLAGSSSFTPDEIETFFYKTFIPESEFLFYLFIYSFIHSFTFLKHLIFKNYDIFAKKSMLTFHQDPITTERS